MDIPNETESTNPYLALRAAKIARNEARLRELGLLKANDSKNSFTTFSGKQGAILKQQKKIAASSRTPQRRSSRISGLANNSNYKETADLKGTASQSANIRKRRATSMTKVDDYPTDEATERINAPSIPSASSGRQSESPLPGNSVRTISLDASILVRKFLGKRLDTFGKYFVIEESFREAAFPEDSQRLNGVGRLSFNKFSGVQPWKNSIFLWINVGGPRNANKLVNDFSHDGSRVTWFGGNKMREDSQIIQNLIRIGKDNSTRSRNSSSVIVLWCRNYDWKTKKLLPYTCLGRLAYESHVTGSHPVTFTWRLLDYDVMIADESKRALFQELSSS